MCFISQLATLYPSDVVSIELYATSPPRASVDGNTFNVTASGEADVFVTDADDVKHSLFVINVVRIVVVDAWK